MKAIRLHEFGGPEVLRYEDIPIPALKPGEVPVRVHAVGINPPDWYLRDGYEKGLVPSPNVSRADTLASFQRFKGIVTNTHARVVIQHAPEDFAAMPAFPK